MNVDFLSLSAHKLHAPKGIGMLYIKHKTPFKPLIIGDIRSASAAAELRMCLTLLALARQRR